MSALAAAPLPFETPASREPIRVMSPRLPDADSLLPYLRRIDEARWYSNFGPLLVAFEARLAERFSRPTAVATVANATQGLALALQAMDVAPGRLCAMPSFTFAATAHAAVAAGLVPWFLDVDEETWMLDPGETARRLRDAPGDVGAVIPVSAFGRLPDLSAWAAFREETGVPVLADAAAAFDPLHDAPVPVVVSLHATKALGIGEGGFLASEDQGLVERFRALTTFGFQGGRVSLHAATNAKLSEYACAVGLAALDRWPTARLRRRHVALALRMATTGARAVEFQPGWGSEWVSSTCVVRTPGESRDRVEAAFTRDGVEHRRWWGEGCHRMPAFDGMPRTALPVTERLAASTIGLPYAIDMDEVAVSRVAAVLVETA